MTKKIKVIGENIEVALEQAAQQLGVPLNMVQYQIVEEKKGIFGFNKEVELEAWTKEEVPEVPEPSSKQEGQVPLAPGPMDGFITVVAGAVKVTNPPGGGKKAQLIPSNDFVVTINNKKVTAPTEVSEEDNIVVEPVTVPAKLDFHLKVSQDKMTATGLVNRVAGSTYVLKDMSPTTKLKLTGEQVKLPPDELTKETVEAKLKAGGVAYGIQPEAIEQLMSTENNPVQAVLAKGNPGTPPVDETISLLYDQKKKVQEEKDAVDHWEKQNVISVDEGEVLAQKTPAKLGEKGMDVTGKERTPPLPKMINLKAGPGVELNDDGMKYLATQAGQPVIKAGTLTVAPLYEVKVVDFETGNVRFNGSVLVHSSVMESMVVEARDDVEVLGAVNSARIKAGGNITINKNLVSSRIHAGGDTAIYQHIMKQLMIFVPIFNEMPSKAQLAREAMGKKGLGDKLTDGYLIKMMLEKMYPQAEKTVKELATYAARTDLTLDDEVLELIQVFQTMLLGLGPIQLDFNEINNLRGWVGRILNKLQLISAQKALIKVGYLQNSELVSSGDIIINGKGGYNSKLIAGGQVQFSGRPGVFRGGTIQAQGDVTVGELGSATGAVTNVEVPKHSKITSRLVYPNVTIKVGNFCEKIQNEVTNFEAWVSERGLEISNTKS